MKKMLENSGLEKIPKINHQEKPNNNNNIKYTETSDLKNSKIENAKTIFTFKLRIICIVIYFLLIIYIETFYREYLFKKSIPFQESIQLNNGNRSLLKFCKILSKFGAEISTLFFFIIIFSIMPLNYSFLFLQSIIYSSYTTNTLKMIYQNDRPHWRSDILTYSCNYGYGNPSGHALTSIPLYLSLFHIIINYFNTRGVINIIFFFLFLIIALSIAFSRVVLAAHSINQVIYGLTLGFGIYFILTFIIGYHRYTTAEFLGHIKRFKTKIIFYSVHIFLIFFSIFIYAISKTKDHSEIDTNIFNNIRCKARQSYNTYKNDGLFQSLSITALIGAFLGINQLFDLLKKKEYMINVSIIEWNKTKNKKYYLFRLPVILLSSIGIILFFIIPGSIPLIFIFIFKSAVPFFLGMFGIYLVGIYLCIYLKIANSEIYKMEILHEITSST